MPVQSPRSFGAVLGTLALGVALSGCMGGQEVPVPEGVQEVGGYVEVVPFSLKRRGTHGLFTQSGGDLLFYLESRDVNLRTLEHAVVRLRGLFERNTDPALPPVLIVDDIVEGRQETLRPWSIPALQLSVRLPSSWLGSLKGRSAEFTESGAIIPLLRVTVQPRPGTLPPAEHLTVGLRDATVELDEEAGRWNVRVAASAKEDVLFSFTPERGVPFELQRPTFERILKTVQWSVTGTAASSSPSPTPTPSSLGSDATGRPCGGPAGILCPAGFYCTITDRAIDAGVCTKR